MFKRLVIWESASIVGADSLQNASLLRGKSSSLLANTCDWRGHSIHGTDWAEGKSRVIPFTLMRRWRRKVWWLVMCQGRKGFRVRPNTPLYQLPMVRPWARCITFLNLDFPCIKWEQLYLHPKGLWERLSEFMPLNTRTSDLVWTGCSEGIYFLPFNSFPKLVGSGAYIQTPVFVEPKASTLQQCHTTSHSLPTRTRTGLYFTRVKSALIKSGFDL